MKKIIVGVAVAITVLSFFCPQAAQSDEISELKGQMKSMQQQMEKMQQNIEKLETEKAARIKTPADVADRIAALEEKVDQPYEGGLLSTKGEKLQIGGELELEFVDTESDASIDERSPHFQVDKFLLQTDVQFTDEISFLAAVTFGTGSADCDTLLLKFADLPLDSELKTGLVCRFMAANRKTERFPLSGNAFWRDGEIGLTWTTKHFDPFYGIINVSQGLDLNTRGVGEDSSYNLLHDDTYSANYNGIKQVGLGLGYNKELDDSSKINILGFGYFNDLSSTDVATLQTNITAYTSNEDRQHRAGANVDYTKNNFNLVAQYIDAADGDLDRDAWFIQPSYKITLPFDWKYCKSHDLLVRYGQYNVDATKVVAQPATWDREELTFAIITDIEKNIKLKTEYSIDDEDTGGSDVSNNELMVQLEVQF